MRVVTPLSAVTALIASLSSPFASAEPIAQFQADVTVNIKLTVGVSHPNSTHTNPVARFLSVRLTQRDILEGLIDDGRIAGPLRGWKIIARTEGEGFVGLDYRLFAVKDGQPDHALDQEETRALAMGSDFLIAAYRERLASGGFYTGAGTFRTAILGTFNPDGEPLYLSGLATLPYSYKTFTHDDAKVSVPVPGNVVLKVTGGTRTVIDVIGETNLLAEGAITLKSHKVVSLKSAD